MSYTVLSAEFFTENNTFKKGFTELRDFRADTLALGSAAIDLRGSAENTELAGFLSAAKELGWTLKHTVSATAAPAGPVSREAFEYIAGIICDAALVLGGELDGILLGLHGAQVVEFCEDGEGELLRRLRMIVGPDLPIAVTLDLHANATQAMVELAQIWVSYKTYPHVDIRLTGHRAAHLLHAAMAGDSLPATLRRAPPMLEEATSGRSDAGAMVEAYARARNEEAEKGILSVSLNAGFAEADIRDAGPSVLVTFDRATEGAAARASAIADAHACAIWEARHVAGNDFLTVEEAARIAEDFDASWGPLVIADYADNPGAGAYGDATNLLRALLDAGVTDAAFAPMVDPLVAQELHRHREGEVVTVDLGGKNDPGFGGGPLRLTGQIIHLSDGSFRGDGPMLGGLERSYGATAVLRVNGIDILVVTEPEQVLDRQQLAAFGINPTKRSVLALKSMQHFRAAFEPIAGRVIVCDSGALATPDLLRKPYRKVRRPVWPLDPETVYSGSRGMTPLDPIELAARLIRCPSVTPTEAGALKLLEAMLATSGFECHRVDRNGIANLFARWGPKGAARTFGFNGHTDVVPVGDAAAWTHDPFGGRILDGILWGRGATDMKSGVAAFVAAAVDFAQHASSANCAIILAITGDEEGAGADGTCAILDWMEAEGERMDVCLVGEPTCPELLGDMIKIGRRGALSAQITAAGVQGHSAYPHRAKNPLTALVRLLDRLASHELDKGTAHFDPSTLAITTIDTGNAADNVIPAQAMAKVNIRYNDVHSSLSLSTWLRAEAARVTEETDVSFQVGVDVWGESFVTQPGPLVDLVAAAVRAETGLAPELSTTGGTSDARFIRSYCPVVEFGLVGKTMHQVDERVEVTQITGLKAIYSRILRDYFAAPLPNFHDKSEKTGD